MAALVHRHWPLGAVTGGQNCPLGILGPARTARSASWDRPELPGRHPGTGQNCPVGDSGMYQNSPVGVL